MRRRDGKQLDDDSLRVPHWIDEAEQDLHRALYDRLCVLPLTELASDVVARRFHRYALRARARPLRLDLSRSYVF